MWIADLAAVTQEGFIQPFRNVSRLCWMGENEIVADWSVI